MEPRNILNRVPAPARVALAAVAALALFLGAQAMTQDGAGAKSFGTPLRPVSGAAAAPAIPSLDAPSSVPALVRTKRPR